MFFALHGAVVQGWIPARIQLPAPGDIQLTLASRMRVHLSWVLSQPKAGSSPPETNGTRGSQFRKAGITISLPFFVDGFVKPNFGVALHPAVAAAYCTYASLHRIRAP